jgi:hypothetical protein
VFSSPIVEIRENLITLPIAVRINATGAANFVESQRARARQLIEAGRQRAAARAAKARGDNTKRAIVNVPATNAAVRTPPILTFLYGTKESVRRPIPPLWAWATLQLNVCIHLKQ